MSAEQMKKCSQCGSPMRLEKRARPEGGPMFVAEDQWICQNAKCGHVEDASS